MTTAEKLRARSKIIVLFVLAQSNPDEGNRIMLRESRYKAQALD